MQIFAIIADGIYDQAVESRESMLSEVLDLRAMGHKVQTVKFESWAALDEWESKHRH